MSSLPLPVGEELRRARVHAGLEISDVAAHLRIRSNFLAALEEGRPDALPGITYAIGYVRTYAGFLGLDQEAAVRRFKEEAAGLNAKTQLVFPSPAPEGRVPGLMLMLVAAVLAGGAFGGWYWVSERDGDLRGLVPAVPERLAQLIEGEAPPLPSATAPAAPLPEAPLTETPATSSSTNSYSVANPAGMAIPGTRATAPAAPVAAAPAAPVRGLEASRPAGSPVAAPAPATPSATPATPPPAVASLPAAPAPEAPTDVATAAVPEAATAETAIPAETAAGDTPDLTAPPVSTTGDERSVPDAPPLADVSDVPTAPRIAGLIGASEAAVPAGSAAAGTVDRVMIRATGDSWVQVRDAQGAAVFTRVLREGDVYRVPEQSGLRLATGNAGALEILVDGAPAPSLGSFGEVVRNVLLEPAQLAAGTAAITER